MFQVEITTTEVHGIPSPDMGQAHECGGVKLVNGIAILQS